MASIVTLLSAKRLEIIQTWLILSFLSTGVFFLIWIYRAHRNLPVLGALNLKYGPGWAVGGLFVPFLNLFRPYQVVKEIWNASDPDFIDNSSEGTSSLIGWWWVSFLISIFVGRVAGTMADGAKTASDLLTASWISLISFVLMAVEGVFGILVIKGIDLRQEERKKRLATDQGIREDGEAE